VVSGDAAVPHVHFQDHHRHVVDGVDVHYGADQVHPEKVDHARAGGATPWRQSAAAGIGGAAVVRHCGAIAAANVNVDN